MIQESVECKRIGNEYVDLFRKLLQYIHYTKLSTDFITDDDLKMLSELEFYISSGKYEIIEFGTRKSPFDVREKLEELEEKNKTFEDYNKNLNRQIDKLEKENEKLFAALDDIHQVIDDQSNIYDPDCDDIEIIKLKAEENSKALDKIFKIVDGDYE